MKKNELSILETIKMLLDEDVHGISFIHEKNSIRIDGLKLTEEGTFITSSLGHMYDILTYRMAKNGDISDIEKFEGVLSGPEVYINNLIKCDFNGFVMKKTEESHSSEYIDHVYEKLCQLAK